MVFKSRLGIAALEELNEQQDTSADNDGVVDTEKKDEAAAPVADTAAAPATSEEGKDEAAEVTVDTPVASTDDTSSTTVAADDAAPATDTPAEPVADAATDSVVDPAADATVPDAATTEDGEAAAATSVAADSAEATGEPAAVVAEVEGDPEAELVEEEMEVVDELEDKSGDVNEDVEKLVSATESLEGCVAILDAAAQRGGLDIFGASLLRNNINTVTSSLKIKPLMLPALEDMETPSAKIDGANTAKDQILAFIKRIIEAIKSAFIRFGEWIAETYKRLTNAFVAIERRAQKLAERAKASKMKEGKLEGKALAQKLVVEGELVKDLPAFLADLGQFAKYMNDPASYKLYLETIDLCEELVKNPEKDEEIRGKISAKLNSWSAEFGKRAFDITSQARLQALFSGNAAHNATMKMMKVFVKPLLNNQGVSVALPDTAEAVRGMASAIETSTKKSTVESVDALDQAAALKVCEQVMAIAKDMRESSEANKGGVKELIAEINKRKDTIAAMANVAGDTMLKDVGAGEKTRKVILFVNNLLMTTPKLPVHAINRTLPRNLSYALDYVAASIGGAAEATAA